MSIYPENLEDDLHSAARGEGSAPGRAGFYDDEHTSSVEVARLRGMADAADRLTMEALDPVADRPDIIVADVGSGESTSLGAALTTRNPSLTYVPVDIRPDAVDAQRKHGFDGRVGSATDLPIADRTVDVFHARFVFGWLDPGDRHHVIEEMVRVGVGGTRAVIIDYDWGVVAGSDAVAALKAKILGVLSAFGFDPYYGQRLAADVRCYLTEAGLDPLDYSLREIRSTTIEPMRDALRTLALTMNSLLERLEILGLDDDAHELRDLHAAVQVDGWCHPDAPLTFPGMVAVTVDFTDKVALGTAATTLGQRGTSHRAVDPTAALPHAGPPGLGVYRLVGDELIAQARRLHASEYANHGHLTDDATDEDGLLITEIDAPDVIARSTYLGIFDGQGVVAGCIRIIRPGDGGLMTLPTLGKLLAGQRDEAAMAQLPFSAGTMVAEASGLARSSRSHDRTATARLLLAVFCEAHRCGDHYVVMGVVPPTAKLLFAMLGTEAIRPLDGTLGTMTVAGTGITPGGRTLIPCYSETATFVGECLQHCQTRPGRELTRLIQPLLQLVADAYPV